MKHSELLREAWKYIEDGRELYVCHALTAAVRANDLEVDVNVVEDVEEYISELLGKHAFYDSWLFENCQEAKEMYRGYRTNAPYHHKLKQSRLAWIEWMIQQYEAKGM